MHRLMAFIRRDALIAASYRVNLILSACSLVLLIVPIYFVAKALQPIAGQAIQNEGGQFFAFVVAGLATFQFVVVGVSAIPSALASGIRTGTLEIQLATPTRIPVLLLGLMGYSFLWTTLRAGVLLAAGALLGAHFGLDRFLWAFALWGAVTLSYLPFGILGGALLLVLRTTGPLPNGIMAASMFLGGVYYPTHVIPSWLGHLSEVIPLTYGLRVLRRVVIQETPLAQVGSDLVILALLTAFFMVISMLGFHWALRYARKTGSLAQY